MIKPLGKKKKSFKFLPYFNQLWQFYAKAYPKFYPDWCQHSIFPLRGKIYSSSLQGISTSSITLTFFFLFYKSDLLDCTFWNVVKEHFYCLPSLWKWTWFKWEVMHHSEQFGKFTLEIKVIAWLQQFAAIHFTSLF